MSNHKSSGGVSQGVALAGMVITFLGGFLIGSVTSDWTRPDLKEARKATRTYVPVESSPTMGADNAPVTVVEFAAFTCGYCARSTSLAKQILADYPGKVRWVFKHFPRMMGQGPPLHHQAAMAAAAQGRFWDYHDLLFANRRKLGEKDLLDYARRLGLDVKRFREALATKVHEKDINLDVALARKLGVQKMPTFFVNGRKNVGAMPYSKLKRMIKQELAYTRQLMDDGTTPAEIYKEVSGKEVSEEDAKGKKMPPEPAADPKAKPQAARPQGAVRPAVQGTIYQIRPGASPSWGKDTAYSTVIMFGDYRCKHTARIYKSLTALRRQFSDERLKVVYKHFPVRKGHQVGKFAARAALAAHDQGKFWPYHEDLLRDSADLSRARLLRTARELRLDVDRFVSDLDSDRFVALVEADRLEGVKFGVFGTPSLFINGRYVHNGGDPAKLRQLITTELQRAVAAIKAGVARDRLYEHLISGGRKSV